MIEIFSDLEKRGILYQITDPEFIKSQAKSSEKFKFYCGFDPTSRSLHIGSLLPLLTMRRLQLAGHTPILLVGGATGMIGDPSGKSDERQLLTPDVIALNIQGIQKVASQFLSFEGPNAAIVVNNLDWFKNFSFLDFLREVGKYATVNHMLAKDSVKSRIESRDHGISYTEFSYMLLQGYDFYHLYKNFDCTVQLGGSDQWGNITAGTDLIRRFNYKNDEQAAAKNSIGMTMPLVTKADGKKFGKSETGTVWLDKESTSPYQLYQFLLQTSDEEVFKFLKYFSFKTYAEIESIMSTHHQQPEKRFAQNQLAEDILTLVHGKEECVKAQQASASLFSTDLKNMTSEQFAIVFAEVPSSDLSLSQLQDKLTLVDILASSGLCASKGAARKDIQGGGIYVNDERVDDVLLQITESHLLEGKKLLLRKGKKNYHLINFK
jgi:tyrosyl-tRNA synthetase